MAKFIITQDEQDKIYEIADEEFSVGSSTDADLVLADDTVSAEHLLVKKTDDGFQIIDMETKAGTVVNGKPVNSHLLQNGDTIEIGNVRITYIGGGPKRGAAGGKRRRGAPAKKKTNIQTTSRSHYRRDTWDSKLGSGGMTAMVLGGVVILGLLVWFFFSTNEETEASDFTKIKNIKFAIENADRPEDIDQAQKDLAEFRFRSDLDDNEKRALGQAKAALELAQHARKLRDGSKAAENALIRLRNRRKNTPNDTEGIQAAAEEFLRDQKEFASEDAVSEVEEILEAVKLEDTAPPEKKELARLEGEVSRLVWTVRKKSERQYKEAYEVLHSVSSDVEAVYGEELEKMRERVRLKSNQVFIPRKNAVRLLLREGKPAEARALMIELMVDKLVPSSFTAYLEFPEGGYSNPKTIKAEKEVQALMRELMPQ